MSRPARTWLAVVLVVLAVGWSLAATGLVSSNDGSHVALARSLALRGETTIDPDAHLTLWVDRAKREGHQYSDRPPGTALLAMPAVWVGAQLDPGLLRRSLERKDLIVTPAGARYAQTHAVRARGQTPLLAFQGTAAALAVHTAVIGGAGLLALALVLVALDTSSAGVVFVVASLGAATLWGPYSTMLFSHVTAAGLLATMLWLLRLDAVRGAGWTAALAGLAGGWAVACDYLLVLAVVPLVVASVGPRRWGFVAAGAVPIAIVTAAYHQAAFGSPLSVGYDFHANFEFARSRASTFDGNPLAGLWILLGAGRGAGALVMSPIVLAGLVGAALEPATRRWLLAMVPWLFVLSMHHTPWGGATSDHRYLIPVLPLAGAGLGVLWTRYVELGPHKALARLGLAALASVSAVLVWIHFFTWRG